MSRRRQKKRAQKAESRLGQRGSRVRKAAVLLLVVAFLSGALAAGIILSGVTTGGPGPRTAVIVDQLSLTQPNPDFVESATGLLQDAGYVVDYFPGEQVTVEFYRELPTHHYDLIILRIHSGISTEVDVTTGEKASMEYVALFTGEPYSETKYPEEPERRLGRATHHEGDPPLFGIGPEFIAYSMRGSFDKALIVLMGCDGLRSQTTAQAFLDRGASAFVSWSRAVSAAHTDAATLRLLEKLVVDRLPVGEAVAQTAAEVGPDPSYGAELRVLPEGG
jgi:hypothetical protein